ncbi:MAG: hypothetical protein ACQEXG_11085 [Pseudomonadota bacterium]
MIIAVINTKGGVGKSAFAMHVAAPYLLSRFGNAELIELDDENNEYTSYSYSKISFSQVKMGDNPDRAIESLMATTSQRGGRAVIDVGGGGEQDGQSFYKCVRAEWFRPLD